MSGSDLTYASTFMHPFYVARLFNSLTTSPTGASPSTSLPAVAVPTANYGFDELMEHGLRYDRMEEFIDVCRGALG